MQDVGNKDQIKHFAQLFNAEVVEMELPSQFRCNGSDGYLAWLDDVLDIRSTANADSFALDFEYDFKIFDDPNVLRQEIINKNKDNKARMLAGYCWDWKTEGKSNPTHDIQLDEYGFSMSWNLNSTSTWAIDPESIDQVGCIHTCQGLEFEYVGVIIGEDLRYEDGAIITDPFKRAKTDKSLSGFKSLYKKNKEEALRKADQIIKNTYRTLMTRGMKGCYIYCVDPQLRNYFSRRMTGQSQIETRYSDDRLAIVAESSVNYSTQQKASD